MSPKAKKSYARFDRHSILLKEEKITQKHSKKLVEELAQIFYDYFCQHQKSQACLSKNLGEPSTPREVL